MLNFRLAEQADITDIVALVESAYRGDQSKKGWTTEADFIDGQRTDQEEVRDLMTKPDSFFLLCESQILDQDQNKLLASVQLNKSADKAYLGMFAVDPLKQGEGIGLALLKQAEHFVQNQWHSKALQMTVISIRQELINWYLRHDYIRTGQLKSFPYEEPRFGKPKRDDLVLEVLEKKLC